jgi:hypothetical protein
MKGDLFNGSPNAKQNYSTFVPSFNESIITPKSVGTSQARRKLTTVSELKRMLESRRVSKGKGKSANNRT